MISFIKLTLLLLTKSKERIKNLEINLHTEMLVKTVSPEKETTPQILKSNKTANVSASVLTKEEQSKDFKVPVDDNQNSS